MKLKLKNIIKYRKEHNKFKSVEEIKEVKGIGEKIYKKIKSSLFLTKGVTSAPVKTKKVKKTSKKKTKATTKAKNQVA